MSQRLTKHWFGCRRHLQVIRYKCYILSTSTILGISIIVNIGIQVQVLYNVKVTFCVCEEG